MYQILISTVSYARSVYVCASVCVLKMVGFVNFQNTRAQVTQTLFPRIPLGECTVYALRLHFIVDPFELLIICLL